MTQQDYDYILVLDFEATCDDENRLPFFEIIEFPTCAVNVRTMKIDYEFHQYVKPTKHSKLMPFCRNLTGILQEWVDKAKLLSEVLQDYEKWLVETKLIEKRIIWLTCGDWDLKKMLPSQCRREGLVIPGWVDRFGYINIKKSFCDHFKTEARGMANMLRLLSIQLEGKHHSGIDDSRNTAKILVRMLQEGYKMTTVFHDVSVTGQYVSVGENHGSVCLSSWFPHKAHVRKYFEEYGTPNIVVTCMNKREGGRKTSKLMRNFENVEHLPISYPGGDLLVHEELIGDITKVCEVLRGNVGNKVIISCSDGWRKAHVFLYLVLRRLGKEREETFNIMRYSRYKNIDRFDEQKMNECEEYLK